MKKTKEKKSTYDFVGVPTPVGAYSQDSDLNQIKTLAYKAYTKAIDGANLNSDEFANIISYLPLGDNNFTAAVKSNPALQHLVSDDSGIGTLGLGKKAAPWEGSGSLKFQKKQPKNKTPWEELKTYHPTHDLTSLGSVSEEMHSALTPSDADDFDELKSALKIWRIPEPTIVFAIVIDKERPDNNHPSAIRCYGGMPFGGYVHDVGRDAYLIKCVEFLQVGHLPFAFQMTMPCVGEWAVKVPIPEKILEKHFPPQQRRMIDDYRAKYKSPRYEINFIQMLGCNA